MSGCSTYTSECTIAITFYHI